jgi:fatty acid desaturase
MTPVEADVLTPYHKVSNLRGAWDLLSVYVLIFAITVFAGRINNPFVTVLAVLLIGGLQNGLVSLQHDAWHHLVFRPNKVNDLVCSWLTAYTVGASYYFNQVRHSGHHAYFGTAKDPDWITFTNDGKETPAMVLKYFGFILCGGMLVDRVRVIFARDKTLPGMDLRPPYMPSANVELACIAIAQLILFALFSLTGHWWHYFLYWFLPVVTVGAFLTTSRQFIEHAHPDNQPLPEERLNEFDANIVEQFFFAPAHFHLHAFHHAYPKVPHYQLTRARAEARAKGLTYKGRVRPGYVAAFVEHMQALHRPAGKMEIN